MEGTWDEDNDLLFIGEDGSLFLGAKPAMSALYFWPGRGTVGEVMVPIPEGMVWGAEMRAFMEAQHKLLFGDKSASVLA